MTAWPRVRLADCAEIISGSTPSTTVQEYWDGDVFWATPKDLSELDGPLISSTPRRLTQAGLRSCGANVLPPESVLFSSRAPIGHVAINTVPMATNQGFKSLVPHRDRLDAKFLYHWMRCNRRYLEGLGNGATFKEVSKAIVAKVEIPLPPLAEQRRIAVILDKADELRAKRRAAIAQLDTLTQSIFLDMFGDPATNPKGWPLASIGEVLTLKSGSFLPSSAMDVQGQFPVFGGNGITGTHSSFMFEEPKLVIGRVGAYCGCIHVTGSKSWVTDNALYVETHAKTLTLNYLAAALHLSNLNQYASQSGQPLISGSRIRQVPIAVPPLDLQISFAERIASSDRLKFKHRESQNSFSTLFFALQMQGFRGEL